MAPGVPSLPTARKMDRAEGRRTVFIDNLRIAMTAPVVFHHAAITHGASGGPYYRAQPQGPSAVLVLFRTVNQALFMGPFFSSCWPVFLLAGHFTPRSWGGRARGGSRANGCCG
jgi:hypothetical protein